MADKIAVNDENYTDLKSALEGKHEIILELLEKVIKDLQVCHQLFQFHFLQFHLL